MVGPEGRISVQKFGGGMAVLMNLWMKKTIFGRLKRRGEPVRKNT